MKSPTIIGLVLFVILASGPVQAQQTDDELGNILTDGIGYLTMGNFDAAFELVDQIESAENQDLLIGNIWNFATAAQDCKVMKKAIEKFNSISMKALFSTNLKLLCP